MSLKSEVDALYLGRIATTNVVYQRYPVAAKGAVLTEGGAAAYAYAAAAAGQVQIVLGAAAPAVNFWVAGAGLDTITVAGTCVLVLWIGQGVAVAPATLLFELQFEMTFIGVPANVEGPAPATVMVPVPPMIAPATGIVGDLATSLNAAETAQAHIILATGMGA